MLDTVETLESSMLGLEQIDCPVTHHFAPGVYMREIFMPADSVIVGHAHTTEHFNIVSKGSAYVIVDGESQFIEAPATFASLAGVRKTLHILEDMTWTTVHPTDETDLDILESELIVKSETWLEHNKELEDQS